MKEFSLDAEEQKLLETFEAGEFQSVMTPARKQFIENVAKHAFQQSKRVNIKVSESDFTAIQKAAFQQGIPHQAFIIKPSFLAFCTSTFLGRFMKN